MATTKRIPYEPDYATRPGEVLEAYLSARGMTKVELAERCGRPTKTISEIIHGKAMITPETALQLARVLGHPPSLWLNLEANYRLRVAEREEQGSLSRHAAWAQKFPVKDLIKRGVIPPAADESGLVGQLLRFFGVGSVSGWNASFGQMKQVAYRRSPAFEASPENVTTWIRLGEIVADSIECAPFNKAKFNTVLDEVRGLTVASFPEIAATLIAKCASAGVAVVFVPELPKTHLSGIARWISKDKALIQLNLRYKTGDHLWFSFFHEAGHVLLHGKKTIFIDEDGADNTALEDQANRFASDHLIPPGAFAEFAKRGDFSRRAVQTFAKEAGIAPGIVVGRLQHERLLPFTHLHDLRERLTWAG